MRTIRNIRLSLGKSSIDKKLITVLIFLVPSITVFIMFKYIPMFQSIFYSFFKYKLSNPVESFVGLKNYTNALTSKIFWLQFYNTFVLFGFGIILGFWVPILQAVLLNELRIGRNFFRYLYLLPSGITAIGSIIIWKHIWNPSGGLANYVTQLLGLGKFQWIYDPELVKFCLRFPAILGGGLGLIIYFVAIQNISNEQFEASFIDGANPLQRIYFITLPNIMYIIRIQFVLALTGSLQAFEDVFIMTGGGPGYSSTTLVLGIYQKSFSELNFGAGMAMSVIIFITTMILTIMRMKMDSKKSI